MAELSLRTAVFRPAPTCTGGQRPPPAPLGELLRKPEAVLWAALDRPVKISHDSLVVECDLDLGSKIQAVALKRFRPRNFWKYFCGLFRPARAVTNLRMAQRLTAAGVSTPEVIAAVRGIGWRRRAESYLATAWIADAPNLHLWGWEMATRSPMARHRAAVACATSLGQLVGRLHAAGLTHRDLKGANLLVRMGDSIETFLIDLDGIRPGGTNRRRAANLARLAAGLTAHAWVSRTECLRFLRSYAAQFPAGAIAWKPLWRSIAARAQRIVASKRRRGQEVL